MRPISGETAMGTMTLVTTPCHFTVLADAIAAPTKPPMRAWVEDEGRPNHQVSRFQVIPPTSAEKTITSPCAPVGVEMIPFPTVAATFVEMTAPTTLRAAAIPSAVNG